MTNKHCGKTTTIMKISKLQVFWAINFREKDQSIFKRDVNTFKVKEVVCSKEMVEVIILNQVKTQFEPTIIISRINDIDLIFSLCLFLNISPTHTSCIGYFIHGLLPRRFFCPKPCKNEREKSKSICK